MHLVCPHCGAVNRVDVSRLDDNPSCGVCKKALTPGEPIELGTRTFDSFVGKTELPVLVDFWAEWCGPCKMIGPALEELAGEFAGKLTVAKVNIDDNPVTPNNYAVRGIPTLILFKNGQPAATQVGALPKSRLKDWISANI